MSTPDCQAAKRPPWTGRSTPSWTAKPLPGPDPDGVLAAAGEQRTINGLELSEYLEGNMDPASTVRAMSDDALSRLADALYRHLDTRNPSFGAHTWYELAAEELHQRHLTEPDGPSQEEVAAS